MKLPDPDWNRRRFLHGTFLATGAAVASTSKTVAASAVTDLEPEITDTVDVLVVGGGTAGTVAAI